MNNVVKYAIGLAALGLTVYIAGVAWRRSQKTTNGESAAFAGAAGGSKSRFAAIKKSGGFGNADGFENEQATFVDDDFSNMTNEEKRARVKKGFQAVGRYLKKKNT